MSKVVMVYEEQCELKHTLKNLTCDFNGRTPEKGTIQCPTRIFNKCQNEEEFTTDDLMFIEKFIKENNNNVC